MVCLYIYTATFKYFEYPIMSMIMKLLIINYRNKNFTSHVSLNVIIKDININLVL
jgi:hypothetical protein